MLARLTAVALFLCMTACASAPADPAAADIARFTEQVMREFPETPSLAVAVVRDGKPLLARGFGKRDLEASLDADAKTAYYIASSTKSYVGLLAAVLAHRGVVDLDAPITRYLPDLKLPEGVEPQRVTLRTLLTHTAGLQSQALVGRTAYTGEHSPAVLLDLISRSRVREPKFAYDNYGYVVASLVLERVTGKKWQDLLDEVIFQPAGMTRTTAYMSRTRDWPWAVPYSSSPEGLVRRPMMKTDQTMHAAGGLVTTAADLLRWLELNINRGRVGGKQVLPAEAFEVAQRQQATLAATFGAYRRYGYGLGWYWSEYEGRTLLHHFGGFEGWRAHISFMPDTKTGVAVLTNTSGFAFEVPDLVANYIYDRLDGRGDLAPTYTARKEALRASIEKDRLSMQKHLAEREARTPTLLRDPSAYVGTYSSRDMGDLTISRDGNELRASIGQLQGTLEPFTEPESARVELVPGSGEVLRFEFGDGASAVALRWRGERLERK
ncbi:MAG TPA: serine hydrolase domain-containing protein [Longimicrobiales bacterium]|nr:serine hydrolase domain-containing protein [Longimicrobiales bacterium]